MDHVILANWGASARQLAIKFVDRFKMLQFYVRWDG